MRHDLTLHDLTLQGGPYTLRPLSESDFSPLMALAQAHAAEYAQMAVHPGTPAFYQGGLDVPDQMVFVKLVGTELAGSTRYLEMRPAHLGLEIGSTWLAPAFMRSGANRAEIVQFIDKNYSELFHGILNERNALFQLFLLGLGGRSHRYRQQTLAEYLI